MQQELTWGTPTATVWPRHTSICQSNHLRHSAAVSAELAGIWTRWSKSVLDQKHCGHHRLVQWTDPQSCIYCTAELELHLDVIFHWSLKRQCILSAASITDQLKSFPYFCYPGQENITTSCGVHCAPSLTSFSSCATELRRSFSDWVLARTFLSCFSSVCNSITFFM